MTRFIKQGNFATELVWKAGKTQSYRIGLGFTLCRKQAPQTEDLGYDSATTTCELPFGTIGAYSSARQLKKFLGEFRGFHIEKNQKYRLHL